MPLQKLQFRPGVNREGTTLTNEGGWFESDKVRFRSGYPEKIGGWVKDVGGEYRLSPTETFVADGESDAVMPDTGSFWGVCRSIWNWIALNGYNLASFGTNLKFYIQNSIGGYFYDVTPIRLVETSIANAFTTQNGSTTVQVNNLTHGALTGDFVTIFGVVGPVNGIPDTSLNKEFRIVSAIDTNTYTIEVDTPATSTGTAGTASFSYQINTGNEIYSVASGWGAGGWSGVTGGLPSTGWGQAAASGVGIDLKVWSQSNFGENLIFNSRGSPMYFWAVNTDPNAFDRGQVIEAGGTIVQKNYATGSGTVSVSIDSTCPSTVNFIIVSDASRFTIAFGCNDPTGVYASTDLDPMQIRWSDQESYGTWTPAITNQAGSYRLSHGSQIVTALQSRQEILIWTNTAIYSMQFLGAPYIWGFQIMGDNISIISQNAAATVNNVTYWMGLDKFYMYSGRVETLPCTLRQYIFDDINLAQGSQVFCGTNEGYNEIWWFYCSANSTVVNKYVLFNHLENTWAYGTMERSAWLDSPSRSVPMATGYEGKLFYHESGNDDGATTPASPIYAYVRSSDFDIGDGHNFGSIWRIIPDVTFDSSDVNQPSVNFTVFPRQNPGSNYGPVNDPSVVSTQNYSNQRTYNVQQFTQYAYVRIRGRQMAFQISSNDIGVAWQLGAPRIDIRPDGRR